MRRAGPTTRKARHHDPRCVRRPNRPPIAHGFLRQAADLFIATMKRGPTPWFTLRLLVDDQVPATGADRQRGVRSELIESLCLVVYCLLARMDLRSLRVGHHAGDGRRHDFVGLTRRTIAEWCDLDESTVSHMLTLLRESGLVHGPGRGDNARHTIPQPCDRLPDGSYERHPAIRQFDELFFTGLGLGWLLHRIRTAATPPDRRRSGRGSRSRLVRELANSKAVERPPDG